MVKSTLILILLSLFLGAGVWLVFTWAVKKGQFEDAEGPKFRMLDDDPPPRKDPNHAAEP